MLDINQFSARKVNKVSDYELFYYCKAYLKKKDAAAEICEGEECDFKDLIFECSCRNVHNFMECRKKWLDMKERIPLKFLEAVEVKLDVLDFTLELDQENFENVIKVPRCPKYIYLMLHPKFYKPVELPENTCEEKAVEEAVNLAIEKDKMCFIKYENLKTIEVNTDGRVFYIEYRPGIEILDEYLYPTLAGIERSKIIF
ncbi:MAG: hypothetical protein ACQESS_11625 [Bacillota bacterium]